MSETTTYTREQVSEAANAAMDLILGAVGCDDSEEDLLSLLVNATMSVLTSDMGADFEDVVMENYDVDDVQEFLDERGW
ncbi:hypothetical protein ACIQUL_36100 [Streptomyces sp. NPDC090303]|uniref:hypothetical protein n=1 Tax=Streptomyces sp. NPDC090303 TaxID=3365960 RepID=UPI0037F841F9